MATESKKEVVVSKNNLAKKDDNEELPFIAKIINHVLTPGSSLSGVMLIVFNLIILFLFVIWMMFVYVMPTSWIVWTFGFLGGGLAASTNFLLYQVLFCLEEPPKEGEDSKQNGAEAKVGQQTAVAAAANNGDDEAKKSNNQISGNVVTEETEAKTKDETETSQREGSVSMRKRKVKKEN